MRKVLIFLALIFAAPAAFAVNLSWEPPILNVDNSPLLDLTGYQIYSWIASSGGNPVLLKTIGIGVSVQLNGLPPGNNCFYLRAFNSAGAMSDPSGTACALVAGPVIQKSKPKAPTSVVAKP